MIRQALEGDIQEMTLLAAKKRAEYELYAPTFWKRAVDAAEKQSVFFKSQLERSNTIALVDDNGIGLDGFLIASIVTAPPVYDPGTQVCMVDDFTVAYPGQWESAGKQLLEEAREIARTMGAHLTVVVSGQMDEPKRQMLTRLGLYVASEWYVGP